MRCGVSSIFYGFCFDIFLSYWLRCGFCLLLLMLLFHGFCFVFFSPSHLSYLFFFISSSIPIIDVTTYIIISGKLIVYRNFNYSLYQFQIHTKFSK